jgi:O-antigen ligase
MVAGVLLLLLHLLPLPPLIWQALPGREFVGATITAAGAAPKWMPLSLSPPLTHLSLLTLLPPFAAFIASLTLSSRERWIPIIVILVFVLASILLGLIQRFQGPESPLYFYEYSNFGSATGTFANRNSFAALLYVAIPLTWALAFRSLRDERINRYIIMGVAALMLLIIILGLAVAGSRAGILLGMIALFGSSFLAWGQQKSSSIPLGSRFAITAMIGALLIVGQFGMVTILRLADTDLLSDYRTQVFAASLRTAWTYFPIGSGFGTFVPIYAMHETPATMHNTYVNHVHNDWLELWIEGGIPVALILVAFLYWYFRSSIQVWGAGSRYGASLLPRAATLAAGLLLLHSLVDYPLRAPALASLFGLFAAFITSAPINARGGRRVPRDQMESTDFAPAIRTATGRAGPFFAPRNMRPF